MNKWIHFFAIVLFLSLFWVFAYANQTIWKLEVDNYIKQGYTLSDIHTTYDSCNQVKEKYNQEYSTYKRSDCFSYEGKYYYFICSATSTCNITTQTSTQNISSSTQTLPGQDKLDAFLAKITSLRQTLNDDVKYQTLLVQVEQQLQTLWERYKANTTISQMIAYLRNWVSKIKTELVANKDMDDFFCSLLGNCWQSSPVSDIENTLSWAKVQEIQKWVRTGLVYIPSDANGTHINGNIPVRNTKLDAVRSPFTGIECPTWFERVWIWMRKENNGATNYQVFTCVKTSGTADLATIPKGTQLWLIYIASDANGVHTNGNTPVSNTKLDAVRYPFTGIECPTWFERVWIWMRKENNGTTNYQVFTCVKTTWVEDLSAVAGWTQLWLIYIPSDANGVHTNGNTPASNTKLDAVKYPFTGIECPTWIWKSNQFEMKKRK